MSGAPESRSVRRRTLAAACLVLFLLAGGFAWGQADLNLAVGHVNVADQERNLQSSAAISVGMCLDFFGTVNAPTLADILGYGRSLNPAFEPSLEFNEDMVCAAMNHFGGFSGLEYAVIHSSQLEEIVAQIAQRMQCGQPSSGPAANGAPALIPLQAGYANWAVVAGMEAEEDPCAHPATVVNGLWLDDPMLYDEAQLVATNIFFYTAASSSPSLRESNMFVPMAAGNYKGEYLAVVPQAPVPEAITPEAVVSEAVVSEAVVAEAVVPEAAIPEVVVAEATVPEAVVAEAVVPEAVVSEAVVPEAVVSEAVVPEAVVAEAVAPEVVVAEAALPEAAIPEVAVPEAAIPEVVVAEAVVPEAVAPEAVIPEAVEPLPELVVSSPDTVAPSPTGAAPALRLVPEALDFGDVLVGTTSATQTVTLTNTGTAPLAIGEIAASGDYAVTTRECGDTLDAGSSCTVRVAFTPSTTDFRVGALTVTSDAATSPDIVELSGAGAGRVTFLLHVAPLVALLVLVLIVAGLMATKLRRKT